MLTPHFEISQCNDFVSLVISAPYTKVNSVEIIIEGTSFVFFAKPYHLKLCLPGEIVEEGSSCKFEVDQGKYYVKVKKEKANEDFPDLDLLTTILCEKKSYSFPSIEILEQENVDKCESEIIDWEDDSLKNAPVDLDTMYGYGFANKVHNIPVLEIFQELISLNDPDATSLSDRKHLRAAAEDEKFDSDHYLADLYEPGEIEEVRNYQPWWEGNENSCVLSSDKNNLLLQTFPNREYLLTDFERKIVFLGLVDILVGYAYNLRITRGEENIISSWTIRIISSTLSWCDTAVNLRDLLIASHRRMLCFPQHRNWELAQNVIKDALKILKLGRRCVLSCLLEILTIFRETDDSPCYILNQLYIQDYCVWIQRENDCGTKLRSLASALQKITITKADVGLELDLLEEAARLAIEDDLVEKKDLTDESSEDENIVECLNLLSIA